MTAAGQPEYGVEYYKDKWLQTNELLKLALKTIVELEAKVKKLEEQINKNSSNSSKPPSTDTKGNTEKHERKERKPRAGKARPPFPPERIDHRVECSRENCPHCNSNNLQQLNQAPFIWQQAELPNARAIVTEFQCLRYACKECGIRSTGDLPEGVPFSSFGPKLMAFTACLTGRFHMAKRDAIQLIQDLYGIDISEGSVINVEENISHALEEPYERIRKFVVERSLIRHFDETSWRDSGNRKCVWICTTSVAACYRIDPQRSQDAFKRLVGTHMKTPSVTDRYSAYNALDGPRQYCLAHLIRNFHFFAERKEYDGEVGAKIENELRKACGIHAQMKAGIINKQQYAMRVRHSQKRLEDFLTDGHANCSDDLASLCNRLLDEFEHLWTFSRIEGMEPTNNMAERDLRKVVLWRKKSYGTRSQRGQQFVQTITSVVETLKKNGRNVLEFLTEAVLAFYHRQAAPYIAPNLGF